jgi:hypothetical protein
VSSSHPNQISPATRSLAAALSLLLVFIGALAAQPAWHAAFHTASPAHDLHQDGDQDPAKGDSGSSEAGCAIALYANSGILFTEVAVPVSLPGTGLVHNLTFPSEPPISSRATHEPPGRAPPAFLFN